MKNHKFLRLILLCLIGSFMAISARAQLSNCSNSGCSTDTVNISTGYDNGSGTWQGTGSHDDNWELIHVPSNSNITLPSPTFIISPHSAWSNFSNATWVSPFQNNAYNVNNRTDPFTFRNCFCICDTTTVTLHLELLADDRADVYLDNNLLASGVAYQFQWANRRIVTTTVTLNPGQHCITVDLFNTNSVAMGFALEGYITGANLLTSVCCRPQSRICGTKYNDRNCDGVISNTDPALSGFVIELRDASNNLIATTTTDNLGNYCFDHLAAGTYTVSEVNQTGWTQTFPAGGTHTINLQANDAVQANFGNCRPSGSICGTKFNDLGCDGNIDPSDPGMGGWLIEVRDAGNNLVASVYTDYTGRYCLPGLPIGTYTVSEVNQPGWTQTYPAGGTHTVTVTVGGTSIANFANCQEKQPCDVKPYFEYEINQCGVHFIPQISGIPSGYNIVSQTWTFGDGYSSNDESPTHYYGAAGTYVVCLTVTIFNGQECCTRTYCTEINIEKPCEEGCKIDADFEWKVNEENCTTTFTSYINYTGVPITTAFWDFGDGTTGNGFTVNHVYSQPGTYKVCLYLFGSYKDGECCFVEICREVTVDCKPQEENGFLAPTKDKNDLPLQQGNLKPAGNIMHVFPNPNGGSFNMAFDVVQQSAAKIRILDMQGKKVYEQELGIVQPGKHAFRISADLKPGTYICELAAGDQLLRSNLVIQK